MEERRYDRDTPSPPACRLLSCTPALGVHTKTAPRLTVDEQLELVGFGRMQALALFAFSLIIMSDGMELVVTNIIWPQLPAKAWGLVSGSGSRALLVSLAFCGFVLGTVISAVLGDLVGRRPLIFVHSGLFIPMSLFSAAAESLEQLAFTRFFVGVSMGIVLPCVCSMMAEYTPHKWRARCIIALPGIGYRSTLTSRVFSRARVRLLLLRNTKHDDTPCEHPPHTQMHSLGQVLVLITGIILVRHSKTLLPAGEPSVREYCKRAENEDDFMRCAWWRLMLVVGVVPDLIAVAIVYMFLPESPRYLHLQGRTEEVKPCISW
jgi:hypothetical protein